MSEHQHQKDFTTQQYRLLIQIAKQNYQFIGYGEVPDDKKSILWRHDVDFSLNRSRHLAEIETSENVSATYFLNPHSDFYSLLEKSQHRTVLEIIELGHDIGLHFDADFYDVKSEAQLDTLVMEEAEWLQKWFDIEIKAFSFHNPTAFLLSCEEERYGGRVNCYSASFKKSVSYCSDSNGYWRHRRIRDVLELAEEQSLQILTHPGWWQENEMPPRERILRCAEGRALFVMTYYDDSLVDHGRLNISASE